MYQGSKRAAFIIVRNAASASAAVSDTIKSDSTMVERGALPAKNEIEI
jgi:hypothetical protein